MKLRCIPVVVAVSTPAVIAAACAGAAPVAAVVVDTLAHAQPGQDEGSHSTCTASVPGVDRKLGCAGSRAMPCHAILFIEVMTHAGV